MCLYSCASRWEPWFPANLAIREPEHWLLALETILCTPCFLARGRGTRASFRRLVSHDYALQQPLIRAGCKRPAPQRPSTHQAACLPACAREARHGEAKI